MRSLPPLLGPQASLLPGFGVRSRALSMVPLCDMNPGPVCFGAIKACHLHDWTYDMGMLLNFSEPQFPPLKSKGNSYYFGWLLQRRKKRGLSIVTGPGKAQ